LDNLSHQLRSQINRAIEILKNGGIVAFPTDTVYGLGCDVFNVAAVERIYKVKQRAGNMPLPVLVAGEDQLSEIVADVPDMARCLIRHFWPGGLTLLLPKKANLPDIITAGQDKVAVRVPNHVVPISLIRGLGSPIIGTSANVSGKPSPVTAAEVEEQVGKGVDLIIDGGRCPSGLESSVVDVTGERPVVLRQGAITEMEVGKVCREYIRR
jgi:L-threonylcarbamoyladenylate synthase